MENHMVFDKKGNPTYCNSPDSVKRFLEQSVEKDPTAILNYSVRIWRSGSLTHISVREYLGIEGPLDPRSLR